MYGNLVCIVHNLLHLYYDSYSLISYIQGLNNNLNKVIMEVSDIDMDIIYLSRTKKKGQGSSIKVSKTSNTLTKDNLDWIIRY